MTTFDMYSRARARVGPSAANERLIDNARSRLLKDRNKNKKNKKIKKTPKKYRNNCAYHTCTIIYFSSPGRTAATATP